MPSSKLPDLPLPSAPVDRKELLDFLERLEIKTDTIEHEALFTVEQSQKNRGRSSGGHTKNLFLKDKKSRYFLITVVDDATIDLKSLHKLIGASGRLSFGKPDKMHEYLGVSPGSVTAFGIINDRENNVTFVLDEALLSHQQINCHPLTNEATTNLSCEDLISFARLASHDPLILKLY